MENQVKEFENEIFSFCLSNAYDFWESG